MVDRETGELSLYIVRFSKAELLSVDDAQRDLYLQLSQLSNEIFMLYNFLIRSMNGMDHKEGDDASGPLKETSLGMIFFVARLLAGRLYEARQDVNGAENSAALDRLWAALPGRPEDKELIEEAKQARRALNGYFGKDCLLGKVRNKLAFHADQRLLAATFAALPDDVGLAEFHSYHRGTTFMGIADTVMSFAVAKLAGRDDVMSGADVLMDDVVHAVGHFSSLMHAYFMAFTAVNFSADRLRAAERLDLKGLETQDTAVATFFLAAPKKKDKPVVEFA